MITIVLVVILVSSSTAKTSERIIGGENASVQSYPFHVSLEYLGSHICGGSIVTQYHVITAAHCQKPANLLKIRAGTSLRTQAGSLHQALKFIPHEKFFTRWSGVLVNDIAIVKVKEPFQFDETRQPINLFPPGRFALPRTKALIIGFGKTDNGMLPRQLQVAKVPIVSKIACSLIYFLRGGLPRGEICAGNLGLTRTDACQGDSGGPLVIDNRLAGIVSWGEGCGKPLFPGVYTEIAYHRYWVDRHLSL